MTTPKPPIEGMKVIPYGFPLMTEAWAGFVSYAANNPEITAEFERDTGLKISSLISSSPIDMIINEATGFNRDLCNQFLDYVTENFWGVYGDEIEEP
jgi:hypothetical protein